MAHFKNRPSLMSKRLWLKKTKFVFSIIVLYTLFFIVISFKPHVFLIGAMSFFMPFIIPLSHLFCFYTPELASTYKKFFKTFRHSWPCIVSSIIFFMIRKTFSPGYDITIISMIVAIYLCLLCICLRIFLLLRDKQVSKLYASHNKKYALKSLMINKISAKMRVRWE
jgi:hypothetical protein